MSAVVARCPSMEIALTVIGKDYRRDLRITFGGARYGFRVALYPKGKGQYYERGGHLVLGCDKKISLSDRTLYVGGAMFEVTAEESEQIEEWMASLPAQQGAA